MDSEFSSKIINKDEWVVCNSKSYPGLNFYVNKITGIKVWNITDSEIAIAEKEGKVGAEPVGFPTMTQPTDAKVYNKEIINNQLTNLLVAAPCPINLWESPQNQPQNYQQQLYTLVPANLAPLLNQAAVLQNCQQLLAQPAYQNNSFTAQNTSFIPQNTQYQRKRNNYFRNRHNRWHLEQVQRNFPQTDYQLNQGNGPDLRKKLIRRKSFSGSVPEVPKSSGITDSISRNDHNVRNEPGLEEQSIKVNLTPLKSFTATNPDSNKWFFVVEKDVILENFNFLNNMIAGDPACNLVVPFHVMEELREHVSISSDVRPRRTLRFLTQQIENGMAMLGEEETGSGSSHNTVLTCVKLASQSNSVVVLIANKKETLMCKPNINNIHIFTIQGVKDILEKKAVITERAISPTMAIKISIPNDFTEHKNNIDHNGTNSSNDIPLTSLFNHYGPRSSSYDEKHNKLPTLAPKIPPADDVSPQKPQQTPKSTSPQNTKINMDINTTHAHERTPKLASPSKMLPPEQPRKTVTTIPSKTPPKTFTTPTEKMYPIIPCKTIDSNIITPIKTVVPKVTDFMSSGNYRVNGNIQDAILTEVSDNYIGSIDTKNIQSEPKEKSHIAKEPYDISNHKNSPKKIEHISPIKHDKHESRKYKLDDTIDSSSNSSLSNISLDTINMKKIISMKTLISTATPKAIDFTPDKTTRLTTKSVSTSTSYDDSNERSLKRTSSENIIIEETSTSGVLSNSESLYSEIVINPLGQGARKVSKTRRRSVVMYTVACQSMEDVLRMRSEEWIFRFVQIMEEVLRIKLQEKINYEKGPAPWNLQDAARCIIKKYDTHFDVVDAANKLSRLLYEMGDENGKIVNLEPTDYMELYSYGVYLVETFMDMTVHCKEADCKINKTNDPYKTFEEDKCSCLEVVNALDLLKKLLFDIQNANETLVDPVLSTDTSMEYYNNSMDDDFYYNDYKMENKDENITAEVKEDETLIENKNVEQIEKSEETAKTYPNLRSQKRKLESEEEISLKIQNTDDGEGKYATRSSEDLKDLKCHFSKKDKNIANSKIVCKFQFNEDFERKVKAKRSLPEYSTIPENLPTENDKSKNPVGEETKDFTKSDIPHGCEPITNANRVTENNVFKSIETIKEESNTRYKCFVKGLTLKLGGVLTQVSTLSDSYVKQRLNKQSDKNMQKQLLKVQAAYSLLSDIQKSLQKIKDNQDTNSSLLKLLNIENLDNYVPDESLCKQYRQVIMICAEKAKGILEGVGLIMKSV